MPRVSRDTEIKWLNEKFIERAPFLPKDRNELMLILLKRAVEYDYTALALAYLLNEICPKNRSTRRVFDQVLRKKPSGEK